jgi:ATP-dependent helicase/nuclease subunit B
LEPALPWRDWANKLDVPENIAPCEGPQPRPPVAMRPTILSVTEISTWMRNPYAIYAKHILKLRKLEELDAELDASDRGMMIHESLEKFTHAFPITLPKDAEVRILNIGEGIFAHDKGNPRIRAFWWARFVDIAQWFVAHERARRAMGVCLLAAEPKGKMTINGLTLKGRADRIDRLADGSLSITDYKTGSVPSKVEITSGVEPQLPLLAMMAGAGGFDKITGVSGTLEYWILKGGRSGCDVDVYDKEVADLIAQAEEGLKNLIEKFADPNTPYEAAPKPRYQPRYNDYAHLSRLAEWGRTVDDA